MVTKNLFCKQTGSKITLCLGILLVLFSLSVIYGIMKNLEIIKIETSEIYDITTICVAASGVAMPTSSTSFRSGRFLVLI